MSTLTTKQGEIVGINEVFTAADGWTPCNRRESIRGILDHHVAAGVTNFNLKIRVVHDDYDQGSEIRNMDYNATELEDLGEVRSNWWRLPSIQANQADRAANLLAIDSKSHRALYEYAMPAGTTALVIVHANLEEWTASVSYATLPQLWFDLIREQNDEPGQASEEGRSQLGIVCGQSQSGGVYAFPSSGYEMALVGAAYEMVMSGRIDDIREWRKDRQGYWF